MKQETRFRAVKQPTLQGGKGADAETRVPTQRETQCKNNYRLNMSLVSVMFSRKAVPASGMNHCSIAAFWFEPRRLRLFRLLQNEPADICNAKSHLLNGRISLSLSSAILFHLQIIFSAQTNNFLPPSGVTHRFISKPVEKMLS